MLIVNEGKKKTKTNLSDETSKHQGTSFFPKCFKKTYIAIDLSHSFLSLR